MNEDDIVADSCSSAFPTRRGFLSLSLRAATLGIAVAELVPSSLFAANLPLDNGRTVNVREFGAKGDGFTDDAAAIQNAISSLQGAGGTVQVPSGLYLINTDTPVTLPSNTRLVMAADATLRAIPTAKKRFYVVLVEGATDVEISGGSIIGDRERHLGTEGEWGYGIFVRGSMRVNLHDIQVSECWGDGICVSAVSGKGMVAKYSSDVRIAHVVCTNNRRQGLTIGAATRVQVVDSEFSHTGGTKPGCGIDIEPDSPETASDILISRCSMHNNAGSGVQIYHRTSRVSIEGCVIRDNQGYGLLMSGSQNSALQKSTVSGNGLVGVVVREASSDCKVISNTLTGNSTKPVGRAISAMRSLGQAVAGDEAREIQIADDSKIADTSGNRFTM